MKIFVVVFLIWKDKPVKTDVESELMLLAKIFFIPLIIDDVEVTPSMLVVMVKVGVVDVVDVVDTLFTLK